MNDAQDINLLVTTTVKQALGLPCSKAASLLRGLIIIGGDHDALDPVRDAYAQLHECEHQLELIARQPTPSGGAAS